MEQRAYVQSRRFCNVKHSQKTARMPTKRDGRTAKLMPRFNRKYKVTAAYPKASIYTIKIPNSTLTYMTFHTLELHPYQENDPLLFPSRELACPGPIITADEEEWLVESIINEQK